MSTVILPEAHGGASGCGGHPRIARPWIPAPWWVPWAGFLGVFVEQSGVRRKVMGISTMEGDAWHRGHVTVWPDGDWQVRWSRVPGTSLPGRGQAVADEGCMAAANLSVPPCPPPAGNIRGGGSWGQPRVHRSG